MRFQRFQKSVVTGRFTLIVTILIAAVCWFLEEKVITEGYEPLWANCFAGFLLHGFIGYLLIGLNNTFALIRIRASVQTSIYLLWVAVYPNLHGLDKNSILGVIFLSALYFLFKSYQQNRSQKQLFQSSLIIGIGSLLFPQLTILIPIFWIGAYLFRSLSLRSLLASLVGWILPYWFLLGYAFYKGEMELFFYPFRELSTFYPIEFPFGMQEIGMLGYLLILYIVSSLHYLVTSYEDKIRTQDYLQFLIFLCFALFLYLFLQPALITSLLSLILLGNSILVGHLFVLTNGRLSNLFFIAALIGPLLLFILNLLG